MENLLVKLMFITAIMQLGISLTDVQHWRSRACVQTLENRSHDVLRINWKPISVWPEEAERFR